MPDLLADRAAVVTGGASGIGRETCLRFAEHGADVVVADLYPEPRNEGPPTHDLVADETDREARYVECDVTVRDDIDAAVEAAEEFGGVDVMVNNAGVWRNENFLRVTEAEYEKLMAVNVKGVFFGAQAAARRMVEGDGGAIVNLSSLAGLEGSRGFVTYCASKGAVRLMTYALAARLGPEGVRVNALHPGFIETAMTTEDVPIVDAMREEDLAQQVPLERFGQPEDVADAALFLASDLAGFVNGASLPVEGGAGNTK